MVFYGFKVLNCLYYLVLFIILLFVVRVRNVILMVLYFEILILFILYILGMFLNGFGLIVMLYSFGLVVCDASVVLSLLVVLKSFVVGFGRNSSISMS